MTAREAVARGTVIAARMIRKRILLDVRLLDGETRSRVELMLPGFLTFIPPAGMEVTVLQVGGNPDHRVAFLADSPALRIAGLAAGEIGLADALGQTVLLNAAGIRLTTPTLVVVDAPAIKLGAGATKPVKLADDSAATKVKAE